MKSSTLREHLARLGGSQGPSASGQHGFAASNELPRNVFRPTVMPPGHAKQPGEPARPHGRALMPVDVGRSHVAAAEDLDRAPNLPEAERVKAPMQVSIVDEQGDFMQFPPSSDENQRIAASADGVTAKEAKYEIKSGGNATDIHAFSIDVPNQVRLYINKDGERWLYFRGPKTGEFTLKRPVRYYRSLEVVFHNYNTFEMDVGAYFNVTRPFNGQATPRSVA